ncbi:MAG: STAS domain-containing protein [Lachnospiraceae bacterium]|nr:STAS domain-containing protein [Lachnospiraceae bacterium]
MLNIEHTLENGTAVIALQGQLDAISSPDVEKVLEEILPGLTSLTFDLEGLEYISSAGLRVLLTAQKHMNVQGEMKLIHVGDPIMDVFEITSFTDILTIE